MSYKTIERCRGCGGESLSTIHDFGKVPLANDFREHATESQQLFPMTLRYCDTCSLVQLGEVVDPALLYSQYAYESPKSPSMDTHLSLLYKETINTLDAIPKNLSVLEIGSNSGDFLKYFQDNGATVLGVDPSKNITEVANKRGIPSWCAMFNRETAAAILKIHGEFDVVAARHVFCHVDDWEDMLEAIDLVTHKDSIVVIEVPDSKNIVSMLEFDTVYHEHLSYAAPYSIGRAISASEFYIERIDYGAVHGGTMQVFLRKGKGACDTGDKRLTFDDWCFAWQEYEGECKVLKDAVRSMNYMTYNVFGYGAPAKAAMWVNMCGFTQSDLQYCVDSTSWKQGKYLPGTNIPITPESEISARLGDRAVLFAWNYAEDIARKNEAFTKAGGRFINPMKL